MAHDNGLAAILRGALQDQDTQERRMFGGLCFMVRGHMLCGVERGNLVFRVGRQQHQHALSLPGARPMDFTGRPLAGFVYVDPDACSEASIADWISIALEFNESLPEK